MGCTSSSLQVVTPGVGPPNSSSNKERHQSSSVQVPDDHVTIEASHNSDDDNITKNNNVESEHYATSIIKLQSFVRASLCRNRVSNHVETLIDELLAHKAGRHGQEEPGEEIVTTRAGPVSSNNNNEDETTTVGKIMDDSFIEEGDDQGVFAALEAEEAKDDEVSFKVDEENVDTKQAHRDDGLNNRNVGDDADQQQEHPVEDEIPDPQVGTKKEVEPAVVVVDEEPSPIIVIRSTTFVEEADQLKDIERAEEDRLPIWWMKYVPYNILQNDEVADDNGIETRSTDFNLARSRFR